MNWDEMMSAADESIAEYYRRYPTAYSEVEFNNVELLYVPEVDSAGDMQYVPAWVFTQTEGGDVLDAGMANGHISQVVYINALDGKYIDIAETAKALGTWSGYEAGKQFQNSLLYLHHVKCLIYVTYVRRQKMITDK